MRVTTKGQVTIPLAIREKLNIHAGAEVDFVVDGNTVRLVPAQRGRRAGDGSSTDCGVARASA